MATIEDIEIPSLLFDEQASAPTTPASGFWRAYFKSDGLYVVDDAGTETGPLAVSGSGGSGGSGNIVAAPSGSDITIPGLAVADRSAGGADDDEFDQNAAGTPSGWTALGSADTVNTSDVPSHLHLKEAAGASINRVGIYKTAPSMPFTITTKITAHAFPRWSATPTTGALHIIGVHASAATPGAMCTGVVYADWTNNPATVHFGLYKATGPTTSLTALGSEKTFAAGFFPRELYLRLVVTSSTSVAYDYSLDGLIWFSVASGQNSGTTIASAGLFIDPNANSVISPEAYFDWIRFS